MYAQSVPRKMTRNVFFSLEAFHTETLLQQQK